MEHHLSLLLFALAGLVQDPVAPPVAKRVEHVQEWHGRKFDDPYFWLREKTSPEVVAYLRAENEYTAAQTRGLAPLQQKIYAEMVGRVKQTDLGLPVRMGAYEYYARTISGQQYSLYCRRENEGAPEQVLLDPNAMAQGLAYLGIGARAVSDDDRLLAYSTDITGFRQYTLHVKDLVTGELRADLAQRVTAVEWAADSKTLFYVTEDPVTKRSNQLWRLELGGKAELVYDEKDELFNLGVDRTKDERYLLLGAISTDTWETRVLDSSAPRGEFRAFLPREKGHKYSLEHRDGSFYVRTNKGAENFRLVRVPTTATDLEKCEELIPHRAEVLLSGFEPFADFGVAIEDQEGLTRFRVLDFAKSTWRDIAFPEPVYAAFPGGTPEFRSSSYRVSYQSLVSPPSVYDIDFATLERELRKSTEILGGYDPASYASERLWATARDGVRVPLSIVYARRTTPRSPRPLWLYAYGSYGSGMPATFDSDRLSLLDRGVVFAIAHIRGGDEMGERWHKDGMLMKKRNTFTDFIDCAEHLVAQRWTKPELLMIEGGSAGGLLMGAVVNLRPDLFRAVHSAVPFVDVMNTMMDASLPLTVGEYLEWGNPNEKPAFEYMLSYSPYDNLKRGAYPAILVTTSFNDSQVMYWEPAKYVAKLRSLKTDRNALHFKCKLEAAGHGGASGRYDRWKDKAFEYAWMLAQVGIRH
ncbi:MAG: S9 family peptidase [Planctomycetes bacterium]|nr:S9 family peptidase [Planctomycetota bacterium]